MDVVAFPGQGGKYLVCLATSCTVLGGTPSHEVASLCYLGGYNELEGVRGQA